MKLGGVEINKVGSPTKDVIVKCQKWVSDHFPNKVIGIM